MPPALPPPSHVTVDCTPLPSPGQLFSSQVFASSSHVDDDASGGGTGAIGRSGAAPWVPGPLEGSRVSPRALAPGPTPAPAPGAASVVGLVAWPPAAAAGVAGVGAAHLLGSATAGLGWDSMVQFIEDLLRENAALVAKVDDLRAARLVASAVVTQPTAGDGRPGGAMVWPGADGAGTTADGHARSPSPGMGSAETEAALEVCVSSTLWPRSCASGGARGPNGDAGAAAPPCWVQGKGLGVVCPHAGGVGVRPRPQAGGLGASMHDPPRFVVVCAPRGPVFVCARHTSPLPLLLPVHALQRLREELAASKAAVAELERRNAESDARHIKRFLAYAQEVETLVAVNRQKMHDLEDALRRLHDRVRTCWLPPSLSFSFVHSCVRCLLTHWAAQPPS